MKLLLILFALHAFAAEPPHANVGQVPPVTLKKGQPAEAVIQVTVDPGFHIQANPASDPHLIPTKLDLPPAPGLSIGSAEYPPGKSYRLQGSTTEIKTYDGAFQIKVPISRTGKMSAKSIVLTGKLKFQACNDKVCFPPTTVPVHVPVNRS